MKHSHHSIVWLTLVGVSLGASCRLEPEGVPFGVDKTTAAITPGTHAPFVKVAPAVDTDPSPNVVAVELVARPYLWTIGGTAVMGYAYNGQIPGPTLTAEVGNTVRVTLYNQLPDPTTVHWHGVNVPISMDGVPWKMPAVSPGESFVYEFVVKQAGTFWYHPHFDTGKQVDLGLYGALVVNSKEQPKPDHDHVVVLDTWGEVDGTSAFPPLGELWGILMEDMPAEHTADHGVDLRTLKWTVNGVVHPELKVAAGETMRLRFINASNNGYLELNGPEIRHIGGDQGLLAALNTPETIVLGPGDRADVEVLVGKDPIVISNYSYSMYGGRTSGDNMALLTIVPEGDGKKPDGLPWGFSGKKPQEDPLFTDLFYVLTGSNEGGLWMINGEVFPEISISKVAKGSRPIVEIRNLSTTEHPFHTHGMAFEVLSRNGTPPAYETIEDTINIRIRESVRLRLMPDEVGEWMVHCHILPHAHGGMMTVLEVVE